jgi:hypothetical protein
MSGLIVAGSVFYALLHGSTIARLDTYRLLVLALLVAIAIGLHGVSHAILEKEYGYVPFYFLFKST